MMFMSPEDMEQKMAERDVARHELKQMLLGLDDDGLRVMEMLFDTIAAAPDSAGIAFYFSGQIGAIRELKFNACMSCGKNHEEDLANMTAEANVPEVPAHVEARRKQDEAEAREVDDYWTPVGSALPNTRRELAVMSEYNLDDLREEGTAQLLGYVCKGCNMRYPTIASRMSREPQHTGCAGCIEKVKFG